MIKQPVTKLYSCTRCGFLFLLKPNEQHECPQLLNYMYQFIKEDK